MANEALTWRELLAHLDETEKKRLVHTLGIQRKTLRRWIIGQTGLPHPQTLQQLHAALPPDIRGHFITLLQQDPAFTPDNLTITAQEVPEILPVALYERVLQTNVTAPAAVRLLAICQLLFRQVLSLFDPARQGTYMALFLCTEPGSGGCVRSLRLAYAMGSTQGTYESGEQAAFLLGRESVAGQAVMRQQLYTNEHADAHEDLILCSLHQDTSPAGIAACPIARDTLLAGALVLASPQAQPFTSRHLALLQQCCHLLVIAINETEWYPSERIRPEIMPPRVVQEKEFARLQNQISQEIKQVSAEERSHLWTEWNRQRASSLESALLTRAR